jgi:hypothetical protein
MTAPVSSARDPRIDVLRGLALVMIFINHVPRNFFEQFTSRNFGFSDAAEGFVLMAGIACGLAYSAGFARMPFLEAAMRPWRRAFKLYWVHLLIIAMAILIVGVGYYFYDTTDHARAVNFMRFVDQRNDALIGVVTLGHQLAYFNILPLYIVLLLAAPGFIAIGRRSLWAMLGVSMLIWVLAGSFRLNIPNYPNQGGWFFNPFAWQFLFVIGLAAGMAIRQGRSLVPANRWLFLAACAYLLFSLVWLKLRMGGLPGGRMLPFFIGGFDKAYLPLPRLLHVLSLAYVLASLPIVMRVARSSLAAPLDLMGRNSLPVFATGSVIAIALQVYRAVVETNPFIDAVFLGSGLMIQYGVALLAMSGAAALVPKQPAEKPAP